MKTRQQITGTPHLPAISMLITVILVSFIFGLMDAQDDLDGRQANYCELRAIFEQSGGQYGWPRLDGYGECK